LHARLYCLSVQADILAVNNLRAIEAMISNLKQASVEAKANANANADVDVATDDNTGTNININSNMNMYLDMNLKISNDAKLILSQASELLIHDIIHRSWQYADAKQVVMRRIFSLSQMTEIPCANHLYMMGCAVLLLQ
jgi:hypothetical protein